MHFHLYVKGLGMAAVLAAGVLFAFGASGGNAAQVQGEPAGQAAVNASKVSVPAAQLAVLTNHALGLTDSRVAQLDVDKAAGLPLTVVVPIEDESYTLNLTPHSIRSPSYQVLQQVEGGELVPVTPGPVRTLRGTVAGIEGSVVAASMLDDGLQARIALPNNEEYWIEPIVSRVAGAQSGDYAVYRGRDILASDRQCGGELHNPEFPGPAGRDAGSREACGSGGLLCKAEVACDADFHYFQDYGSVTAVENRINAVINAVNIQYERDVSITHEITTIIVRTSSSDNPYTTSDSGDLLGQFRTQWITTHGSVQRDVAHLFTGRNLIGTTIGIAWTNAVCTSLAYSLVQSDCCGSFGCTTDLSAHELGHNWGAFHCSCSSWTMNPGLTCANQFHSSFTVPDIVSYRNSIQSCLEAFGAANDDCADATEVGNGVYAGSTVLATNDGSANCGSSSSTPDVWYKLAAAFDGTLTAETCGSSFDTVVSIHSGCPGTVGNQLECNDDSDTCGDSSTASSASISATGGNDYWIRVSGSSGASGEFVLTVSGPVDDIAPSPDPMFFSSPPTGVSVSQIEMAAAEASDAHSPPIQYRIDNVSGGTGGSDSGWQPTRTYVDGGLETNTAYTYVARARDALFNTTGNSAEVTGYTLAALPGTPTLGDVGATSMSITLDAGENPDHTEFAIRCASSPDAAWDGMFVDAAGDPGPSATWQTVADWGVLPVVGLVDETEYCWQVVARNGDGVETAFSSQACAQTSGATVLIGRSCMTHGPSGEFCIDLGIGDGFRFSGDNLEWRARDVEELEFDVTLPVSSFSASVSCAQTVTYAGAVTPLADGSNTITVQLDPALPRNDCCTVTFTGEVTDQYAIGTLQGSVDGDLIVNTVDFSAVKARWGQNVDASNFRYDMNIDGFINTLDTSAVKARFGNMLSSCP